jgi:hypothetical protein
MNETAKRPNVQSFKRPNAAPLALSPRLSAVDRAESRKPTADSRLRGWTFALLLCVAGCQTDRVTTSDGWRMPPAPRAAPTPPPSLRADRMVFTVGSKPDDTNNNGFPDQIKASVALFSSQHPTAIRQDGAFVFEMYPQGQFGADGVRPLAHWRIEGEALKQFETVMLAGPSYMFQLSLLERGTDRLPLERADLVCIFEPADGSPAVRSQGVRTIQIGRRLAADAR